MFFASENNPKGPNIKHLEDIAFDLSGIPLKFSIPPGNSPESLDKQFDTIQRINIYETDINSYPNADSRLLLSRWFVYKGFLGQNLGSFQLSLNLYYVNNDLDLRNTDILKMYLHEYLTNRCARWNLDTDENAQIHPPESFAKDSINGINYLKYFTSNQHFLANPSFFVTAINDNAYLEFSFRFLSVIDENSKWFKMAKDLEMQIMMSVSIKLK
jgi:hypothetical protein